MDEIFECLECGNPFMRQESEGWKTLCFQCWRLKKEEEGTFVDHRGARVRELEEQVAVLRGHLWPIVQGLEEHLLDLIKLCHPDRNPHDPETAHRVTIWLLKVKETIK